MEHNQDFYNVIMDPTDFARMLFAVVWMCGGCKCSYRPTGCPTWATATASICRAHFEGQLQLQHGL
eukprot:4702138-Amphidinium_carterae.1